MVRQGVHVAEPLAMALRVLMERFTVPTAIKRFGEKGPEKRWTERLILP